MTKFAVTSGSHRFAFLLPLYNIGACHRRWEERSAGHRGRVLECVEGVVCDDGASSSPAWVACGPEPRLQDLGQCDVGVADSSPIYATLIRLFPPNRSSVVTCAPSHSSSGDVLTLHMSPLTVSEEASFRNKFKESSLWKSKRPVSSWCVYNWWRPEGDSQLKGQPWST